MFEMAVLTEATARRATPPATAKALKAWLSFGVDLAAVERLALVLVAKDFIG